MIVVSGQGDFADAWDAALATAVDGDAVLVPPGSYTASRGVQLGRRVVVLAWGAVVTFQKGGFWVRSRSDPTSPWWHQDPAQTSGADRSAFIGLEIRSTKTDASHGFRVDCPAYFARCVARKFGGDGWHVEADIVHLNTNANGGMLVGCESTGHDGRAFYWKGGDANCWTAIGCTTSGCAGGYIDDSFLGNRFLGCHSGNHLAGALGYHLSGDSSRGVVLGCYQEGGHAIRVDGSNVALGNFGAIDPAGTGLAISGRSVLGRMLFGSGVAEAEWNGPLGLVALRSALDHYGLALRRETAGPRAGWWVLRRANTAAQDVMAIRADGKTQTPPELWAPLGLRVGAVDLLPKLTELEDRIKALEVKP